MSSARVDPKIIDLIKEKKEGDSPFTSLEYFPPRSDDGVKNLYARMERMKTALTPLFTDVTWGAGGSTADLSMQIAQHAHDHGHVANLHMTCTNMGKEVSDPKLKVKEALQTAWDGGIRNIVALRGDPPAGKDEWTAAEGGFTCALDLVIYIRANFGNDFGIAVAGYPEGHPNAITEVESLDGLTESELGRYSKIEDKYYVCKDDDYVKEMDYLKKKVDAGSDLIITQMFFDVAVFIQFVKDCRKWGITVPVIPGLMCINAYPGFKKMTKFCKTRVPPSLAEKMDGLKESGADADAIKAFGIQYGADMCNELKEFGVDALHFYTLNLEKVVYGILDGVNGTSHLKEHESSDRDAGSMVAVGSAWARVGDRVKTQHGKGTVVQIDAATGAATIEIDDWVSAGAEKRTTLLEKGAYEKDFS